MENKGVSPQQPAAGLFDDASFSAVLQDIFQQAQKEIESRNRNLNSRLPVLRPNDMKRSTSTPSFDVAGRFEPLVDPALSFISDILAEDEEPVLNHPFLNQGEFIAYQTKVSEMAAILKEGSPALPLGIDNPPVSPDGGASFSSSVSDDSSGMFPSRYLDVADHSQLSVVTTMSTLSEPSRNELLLSGLRGPANRGGPPTTTTATITFLGAQFQEMSSASTTTSIFADAHFQEVSSSSTSSSRSSSAAAGSGGAILGLESRSQLEDSGPGGVRSHGQRIQKPSEKKGRVLKPRKEKPATRKNRSSSSKASSRTPNHRDGDCCEIVELNDLLLECAYAVGANNRKRAVEILNKVRQYASPYGNGAERLAYYFAEAMEARFSGTGWPLYLGLLKRRPSPAEILKSIYMYMERCPFVKAYHYFINQSILNVARGATKLYILELQIDGFQYPALFRALAERPGGPPEVDIIGIGFPHYSMMPVRTDIVLEAVERTGKQLEGYAASCGVPLRYTAWAGIREELRMQDFVSPYRQEGEVLVVISASLLRYVMDDTLDSPLVRSKLLKQGRDINPEVYVQGIVTGSYSTPFFTRRFKEALFHFESVFDMLDTFIEREKTDRLVFESEILGKAILNIVACEGTEVVDRIDKYKHWQLVTEEVGFEQLALDEEIKSNVQRMLESWHEEYIVTEDSQYLLMGWKGRLLHAMSTWTAKPEEEGAGFGRGS